MAVNVRHSACTVARRDELPSIFPVRLAEADAAGVCLCSEMVAAAVRAWSQKAGTAAQQACRPECRPELRRPQRRSVLSCATSHADNGHPAANSQVAAVACLPYRAGRACSRPLAGTEAVLLRSPRTGHCTAVEVWRQLSRERAQPRQLSSGSNLLEAVRFACCARKTYKVLSGPGYSRHAETDTISNMDEQVVQKSKTVRRKCWVAR